ncbi:hypothetical protein L1887_28690 [Cichorium endivia]|nr:hypothetical protein L1887_28690 [Cichorium endivia]
MLEMRKEPINIKRPYLSSISISFSKKQNYFLFFSVSKSRLKRRPSSCIFQFVIRCCHIIRLLRPTSTAASQRHLLPAPILKYSSCYHEYCFLNRL